MIRQYEWGPRWQALKSPHIVGLSCPYSRSLLTLKWSAQAAERRRGGSAQGALEEWERERETVRVREREIRRRERKRVAGRGASTLYKKSLNPKP